MVLFCLVCVFFFFQAEDGIRDLVRSRGLGDVYKRQLSDHVDVDLEGMVTLALELGYGVLGLAQAATLILSLIHI